jgi:hypothetical protein
MLIDVLSGISGPGFPDDFKSNEIIGTYQFQGAQTLMGQSLASVTGSVRSVHIYMNMYVVSLSFKRSIIYNMLFDLGPATHSHWPTAQQSRLALLLWVSVLSNLISHIYDHMAEAIFLI